jgi:hypothetical protein
VTTQEAGRDDQGEAADAHRRFIERIDRTIIALLCERLRLDEALGRLTDRADEDEHGRLGERPDGGARDRER